MEVDTRQNLEDDLMSDCWSLGGNYHPSNQSGKISIGIMIESLGKKRSGITKKNEIILSNAERAKSNKENSLEGKNKGKGVIDTNEVKRTEAAEMAASPWITTRSFQQKTTSQSLDFAKETSNLPATSGSRNKFIRAQNAPMTHSVQFLANQTSVLHSGDGKQKKFDGFTYKKKGGKDGHSQGAEDFTFVTAQKVLVSDKAEKEDSKEDRRTETLRMRLWEILGTVSSPRSQPSNSEAHEGGDNNFKPEQIHHQKGDAVVNPIQNSDTKETDSENPDHTVKRPVTLSSTKKRVSTKVQPAKAKTGPLSSYRQKLREKSIFSFKDGLFRKGDVAVSGGSSMSTRKKGQGKSFIIEPRRIHFNESNSTDEIEGVAHRSETPPAAEKASSLTDKIGNFKGSSTQSKAEYLEQKNINKEGDHPSPKRDSAQSVGINRVDLQGAFNSPVPENEDQQGGLDDPSLKNVVEPQDEFQSPTLKLNTPILSSSPSSTPKNDQVEHTFYSPAPAERGFTLGNIRSFKTLWTSEADYHPSDAKIELFDDAVKVKESPPQKPSPLKGTKEVEDALSESSSEDGASKSSEEDHTERDTFSPEIAMAGRSTFMFYPTKRLRKHEGDSVSKFDLSSPSPKGTGASDWNPEPSEQIQENELERVITLFVFALENFKNKMKLATKEKSSEILRSVSEEIHLQLQNIELQIQTDVGKLTSISKAKRKRLETRFQEQQEKLKLIHDRFKQDIHQHLQDCKSTVEELEKRHIELKGNVKKQQMSHQKLVMKVGEAIETQLNDASRRITAVHKSAREKMLQLQHVIGECLNEDSLS